MSTQFRPLAIPPGVVATATKKQASSNWAEANLTRWREGQLMPVLGQLKYAYSFASRCKEIHSWYGLDGISRTAYLCEANLYVDTGGTLTDITPSGGLTPPTFPTGGYGDGVYGGPQIYATAAFTTSSPNITMAPNPGTVFPGDAAYNVTTSQPLGTVLTYVGTALVLTANAGGASSSAHDLLAFRAYGTAQQLSSSSKVDRVPDAFSLDNFGSILYAMTSPDGRLLMWDPAVGGLAVVQPPASGRGPVPTGRCFVVTQERFVMIFGAYDATNGGGFRRFAWCDQENPGAWDYASVTSQAGFLDIEPASPIICAIATRTGTLFWTGKKTYQSRFLSIPYVYNYVELADSTTPWSPQSMVNTSAMVVWFSEQGLFSFDGTSIAGQACMVRPWVDDDIDIIAVREQACAVHVSNFNEFWWFFPQASTGSPYNTRAIIYNYKEGWWSQARMARSAGVTAAYTAHTIMANGTVAYQHEVAGQAYSSDAALPFAETFDLNIANGSRLTTVKQLIPDIEGAASGVAYSLFYRNGRVVDVNNQNLGGPAEQQTPQRPVNASNGYVDFRTTGRDIRLRIDLALPAGAQIGSPPNQITGTGIVNLVTIGSHLIDAVPRGDR